MQMFEDIVFRDEMEAARAELQDQLDLLKKQRDDIELRLKRAENVLTKDSTQLHNLIFDTVFPNPDQPSELIVANGATTTYSDPFDISKQSKDEQGNVKIPHAFYIISAYAPELSPSPRTLIYAGTPIAVADISVYVERTAVATPTRFESRVGIYNFGTTTDVYVKVLKILGVR